VRRLALLLAVSTVAAAVAGLTWGTSAFAAPARPDLVVDLTVGATEVPAAGGIVQVAVVVRNVGSASADNVALKIRPPAGATLGGEGPGAPCRAGRIRRSRRHRVLAVRLWQRVEVHLRGGGCRQPG
jgi:hypothetical protein